MNQNPLFIESLSEAISEAVNQLGGAKKVGSILWPEKTIRDAGNQLLNCLNPDHAQKLSLEQIDLIIQAAREKDDHTVMKYLSDRFGYKFEPITKESVKAEITTRLEQIGKEFADNIAKLERLRG